MQSQLESHSADGEALDACWRRVGVDGDRSCERLNEAVHCRNCSVFSAAGQMLLHRKALPNYLDERTRELAEVEEAAAIETLSLLIFRVGPEWLALLASAVVEVVEPRPIHRVPHRTDRLLLGLANIRGELQLCISLAEMLGIELSAEEKGAAEKGDNPRLPESASSNRPLPRLLVAEHGHDRWVFPVDEVEGVYRLPADAMEDLPHTVEKSPRYYSQALFSHENKRIGLLSATRLFEALGRSIR